MYSHSKQSKYREAGKYVQQEDSTNYTKEQETKQKLNTTTKSKHKRRNKNIGNELSNAHISFSKCYLIIIKLLLLVCSLW